MCQNQGQARYCQRATRALGGTRPGAPGTPPPHPALISTQTQPNNNARQGTAAQRLRCPPKTPIHVPSSIAHHEAGHVHCGAAIARLEPHDEAPLLLHRHVLLLRAARAGRAGCGTERSGAASSPCACLRARLVAGCCEAQIRVRPRGKARTRPCCRRGRTHGAADTAQRRCVRTAVAASSHRNAAWRSGLGGCARVTRLRWPRERLIGE
jgi:hypothetical protein